MLQTRKDKVVKIIKTYALDHGYIDLYKDSEKFAIQLLQTEIKTDDKPVKNEIVTQRYTNRI